MKVFSTEFYDKSIILSPILFYLGYVSFNYSENSFNILFCILIPLTLIYNLIIISYLIFKKDKVKKILPKIIILLSPLLIFPIIIVAELFQKEQVILVAKNNEGKNLYLYSNNDFKYTSQSFLGTDIDIGTFEFINNNVILKFSTNKDYEIDTLKFEMKKDSIFPIDNDLMAPFLITKNTNSARH
jgi:amino acid transporter